MLNIVDSMEPATLIQQKLDSDLVHPEVPSFKHFFELYLFSSER